jgi:hypothetical protein
MNLSLSSIDLDGKKREKVGMVEIEKYDRSVNPWTRFLDSLNSLCPFLPGGGYTGLPSTNTMVINPSDRFVISPCLCIDPCDCAAEQKALFEDEWCNDTIGVNDDDPFQ